MTHKKTKFLGTASTRRKKNTFVSAYDKSACNVSAACRFTKISRNCYYDWMKTDSYFRERIEELDEEILDMAEGMLKKNIHEQKEASIFFFLKTKGKHRGYIETIDNQLTINPFEELMKAASQVDDE
jgi:hypothetical protein